MRLRSLHEKRCLDVLHAASVKDFKRQVVDFSQGLGFETVAAMVTTEHSPSLLEMQSITNAPPAFLAEFHDLDHSRIDPVLQHCKRSSSPIMWDRQTYAGADTALLWERQAPFGYCSGIAIAMHFRRGKHFMFGANWGHDRCNDVPHFGAIAEDLIEFGRHAQAAMFELCLPSRLVSDDATSFAYRELEALRWTSDGLTAWEVADRMSISRHHVTLLLHRVMQKLNCSSKYEAGLRAIRLGLIQCG